VRAEHASATISVDVVRTTANAGLQEAQAALKLAEASVETAKAHVTVAESGLEQARVAVTAAEAGADEARASAAAAEEIARRDVADFARYEQLQKTQNVTAQQLDFARAAAAASKAKAEAAAKSALAAEARVDQAKAAAKAAEGVLAEAGTLLAQAGASVLEAQARVAAAASAPEKIALGESQAKAAGAEAEKAAAAVRQAELAASYARVLAPVSGRVTHKMVAPGQFVAVGQSLLAIVPREVWVVANFKETQLAHMRPGQAVRITVDAYPGVVFAGRVESLQAGTGAAFSLLPPQNATGNYIKVVQRVPVKIVFDEPPDPDRYHLAPGMSVVPEVDVSAAPVAQGDSQGRAEASPAPAGRAARE